MPESKGIRPTMVVSGFNYCGVSTSTCECTVFVLKAKTSLFRATTCSCVLLKGLRIQSKIVQGSASCIRFVNGLCQAKKFAEH